MATPSKRSLRQPMNMTQHFRLVWLNENNDNFNNSITQLQQVSNLINAFDNADECIDFVSDMTEDIVFMIVSETLCRNIMPVLQDICRIKFVYIFSHNHTQLQNLNNEWSKIKGVYMDIASICDDLQTASETWDRNTLSINLIKQTDRLFDEELNTLECSFMYTQILKEILLTINFTQEHIDQFLTYYKEQLPNNTTSSHDVKTIKTEYYHKSPIYWYTRSTLLYTTVNRALRSMDVRLIVKLGFFLRDLHQNIVELHIKQFTKQSHLKPFTVYRGQGLSQTDFDQLKNAPGCLLSFNSFLSTSYDRAVSYFYAESNVRDPNLIGILFQISVDPSIAKISYANINNESQFQQEEEILFSMHSVFRVGQVKQLSDNTRVWQIDLILTSDTDPQLCHLMKRIHEETSLGAKGWFRLGQLLIKLAQFDKAEELYNSLLEQTTDQDEKSFLLHHLGINNCFQANYTKALDYYEKALNIREKKLPANHPDIATLCNNIGSVYDYMSNYSQALKYYEQAHEIYRKTLPTDHPNLATTYNNIGRMYKKMNKFSDALTYHERSVQIKMKILPKNHPDLAASYNNIGSVYHSKGEYSKALTYYEKALEIFQKSLPAKHPHWAASFNNIGSVYDSKGEYSKALTYYEKALEIFQETLPAKHPQLAASFNNIGSVYDSKGEYSKALTYYEKALEIFQETLPAKHPQLAASFKTIGSVYDSKGEYSKALGHYEKVLEIFHENPPENPLILATSYKHVGSVCDNLGNYYRAIEHYEKALEIFEKILPENHPYLAAFYNNIGDAYHNMGNYSRALEYYEKDLEIAKRTLPATDPDLAIAYYNVGQVYIDINEDKKALEYFELALDIKQRSSPPADPSIEALKESIEFLKKKL